MWEAFGSISYYNSKLGAGGWFTLNHLGKFRFKWKINSFMHNALLVEFDNPFGTAPFDQIQTLITFAAITPS